MAGENDPLWVVMRMAGDSAEGTPRDAAASEITALAYYVLPEEPEPAKPDDVEDGMGWPEWYEWLERKRIRQVLLDAALEAETGD
jgi:hypothetical protein